MKKAYLTPETAEVKLGFKLMQSMNVVSDKTTGSDGITGGDAKGRADEEEEAYLHSRDNEAGYGDLW